MSQLSSTLASAHGDKQEASGTPAQALTLTPLQREADSAPAASAQNAPAATAPVGHRTLGLLIALALLLGTVLGAAAPERWGKDFFPASVHTPMLAGSTSAHAAPVAPAVSPNAALARTDARPNEATPTVSDPAANLASAPTPTPQRNDPLSNPGRKAAHVELPASEFLSRGAEQDTLASAYAALRSGRLDEAEHLYTEVLKSHGEERDALLGLAYIAQRTARLEEALTYYQRVLRQDPNQTVAHAGLLALSKELDLTQASFRAREMAERHPESAAALAVLAGILVKQERLADAALAFARAQALEPTNATHAYNLAVALDRLHQYGQAQSHYERALALAALSEDANAPDFSRSAAQLRLEQLRLTPVNQPRP